MKAFKFNASILALFGTILAIGSPFLNYSAAMEQPPQMESPKIALVHAGFQSEISAASNAENAPNSPNVPNVPNDPNDPNESADAENTGPQFMIRVRNQDGTYSEVPLEFEAPQSQSFWKSTGQMGLKYAIISLIFLGAQFLFSQAAERSKMLKAKMAKLEAQERRDRIHKDVLDMVTRVNSLEREIPADEDELLERDLELARMLHQLDMYHDALSEGNFLGLSQYINALSSRISRIGGYPENTQVVFGAHGARQGEQNRENEPNGEQNQGENGENGENEQNQGENGSISTAGQVLKLKPQNGRPIGKFGKRFTGKRYDAKNAPSVVEPELSEMEANSSKTLDFLSKLNDVITKYPGMGPGKAIKMAGLGE